MKVKPIDEIIALLSPIAAEQGLSVYDVEFRAGDNPSLTVYIDREGGIDLDACEKFHRAIDAPIDEFDPTFGAAYTLNVSSVGADRPFKTDADFEKHLGGGVEVKLHASVKGKKFFEGELLFFDEKVIRVKVSPKETLTFDRKNIVKVNELISLG